MKAFILFTRIPKANFTKTRLMTHLTANQCEQLHRCFLEDLYITFSKLDDIQLFLCYAPENEDYLEKMSIPSTFRVFVQEGQNLGIRLENAFNYVMNQGYSTIILTGADIPQLSAETIKEGFLQLESHDVAIGGTKDGGYYLIGMREVINTSIFQSLSKWPSDLVYEETMKVLSTELKKVHELEKIIDIDTWEDIISLDLERLPCLNTRDYLIEVKKSQ